MNAGLLTNPRFIVAAALGLVLALGFFLRRHLAIFLVAVLIIAVVVLGLVLWMMLRELRAAKAGKGIQGDLDKQVEREIEKSVFGQDVAVRSVKAEWDTAIAEFRKSPVGRRLGDKALAQLPMYFVIGPENAGKSTLIKESGLSSVLRDAKGQPRAVRGVGGGRDFSWWFTEQAFLLDMSGRTLKRSQFDDTEDWVGFLKSLQKQRPERPINGVVLAVDLHEVAGGSQEQVNVLATALRERLRDLGHHLRMEFPVWVVFTHCDRIAGFAEMFEGLSDEERGQAWGATLRRDKSREAAAESLFESEYRTLVAALGDLRMARVHALGDDAQRLRALAFPAQMGELRAELQRFVGQVFPRAKGPAEGGFLRGFYFACSQVSGETVDRVLAPPADAVGLTARLSAPTPEVARQAWFTAQFWRKNVLRDATLASASEWARKQQVRQRWMMLGGLGGAYLLVTLLFVILAVNVAQPIRQAASAARSLAGLSEFEVARKALVPLDAMRVALERLEANRAHKSFAMHLGAYAGDGVVQNALDLYVRQTEKHLLQPLAQGLRDTLEHQIASPATPFASVFYQYQVYRLLADPHATVEPQDAVVLGKVLVTMLRPELEHVPADTARAYAALAREQASCLAAHNEPRRRFGDFDEALAARAIATLQQRWSEWPALYDDMIADANEALPALTVRQILHDAKKKQELFLDSPPLAGAFTRQGWERFVRPRLGIMKHVVQSENDPELNRELGDKVRGLTAQLGQRYADGYVKAWVDFLTGLKGQAQGRQGRESLQREATFDSEILAVMNRTLAETNLEGEPVEVLSVPKRFSLFEHWLTARKPKGLIAAVKSSVPFLRSESEKPEHLFYQEALAKAYKAKVEGDFAGIEGPMYTSSVVKMVLTAAEPGYVSYDSGVVNAFKRVLLIMGGYTVHDAGNVSSGTPAKVDAGDPVKLRDDWSSLITGSFGALDGKYPMSEGGQDSKIADFGAFFKPGGSLDLVYNAHFKGRMSPEGKVIGNLVAGTTPAMCAWLAKAMAIQQAFSWSGADPKLTFDVKSRVDLLQPGGALHSVTWIVGSSSLFYDMGESELQTLVWSAETAGRGSALSADVNGGTVDGPKVEGEWGLFHVLDKAALAPLGGGRVRATWRFGGVTMGVEITPRTTTHPFSSGFMRLGPPPAAGN